MKQRSKNQDLVPQSALQELNGSRPMEWVREHPLSAFGIAVGLGFLGSPFLRRAWKPALLFTAQMLEPEIQEIKSRAVGMVFSYFKNKTGGENGERNNS